MRTSHKKNSSDAATQQVYHLLLKAFGEQHWWPAETPFEVVVGAVLVQNTAWSNVSKVIAEIKSAKLFSLKKLLAMDHATLAGHLRGSGYFNVKAKRLRAVLEFLDATCGEELTRLSSRDPKALREELLAVHGVGCETADSIILYAVGLPTFVIDAYTFRVWERLGLLRGDETYDDLQAVFESHLPRDAALFAEYHGLIVRLCKEHCIKRNPQCCPCPLRSLCSFTAIASPH